MKYIRKNMCDNSRVYKFDSFKEQQNLESKEPTEFNEPEYNSMCLGLPFCNEYANSLYLDPGKYNRMEEEKLPQYSDQMDPHVSRMNKTNLNKFDHIQDMKKKREEAENHNEGNQNKLFKITKMNNKKESSQESFYNISSEEQKQMEMNYPFMNKNMRSSKEASDGDSNMSTSPSYICLNGGKIIIKGNEIETTVPCDIETINNKVTMISPQNPVKIVITPISLSQPYVFDQKNRSFASKNSSQSMERKTGSDAISQSNTAYSQMMSILDNNFCLGDLNHLLCRQNSTNPTMLTSQNSKVKPLDSQMQ